LGGKGEFRGMGKIDNSCGPGKGVYWSYTARGLDPNIKIIMVMKMMILN